MSTWFFWWFLQNISKKCFLQNLRFPELRNKCFSYSVKNDYFLLSERTPGSTCTALRAPDAYSWFFFGFIHDDPNSYPTHLGLWLLYLHLKVKKLFHLNVEYDQNVLSCFQGYPKDTKLRSGIMDHTFSSISHFRHKMIQIRQKMSMIFNNCAIMS